jgi:hypothetical protein
MIDEDSVFIPYSGFVLSTLRSVRSGWARFYASAGLVGGLIVGTQVLAALYPSDAWLFITIVAINLAGLIYFRLIGRLAYVIDRSIPRVRPHR